MTAALTWAVIILGAGNVAQVAERWHLVNRATELADRIAGMHGERVRVVGPPKQPSVPKDKPAAQVDGDKRLSVLGGESTGEVA